MTTPSLIARALDIDLTAARVTRNGVGRVQEPSYILGNEYRIKKEISFPRDDAISDEREARSGKLH